MPSVPIRALALSFALSAIVMAPVAAAEFKSVGKASKYAQPFENAL